MFNVCPHCGQYQADKLIDATVPTAICAHCGRHTRFRHLPLLCVCGPSGDSRMAEEVQTHS